MNTVNDAKLWSWDDNGLMKIRGADLGGNIVDLINDAMRERKDGIAVGREQFLQLLRDLNTPSLFVGNKNFWKAGSPSRKRWRGEESESDDDYTDASNVSSLAIITPRIKKRKSQTGDGLQKISSFD